MEKTLSIIKPDAVRRNLEGKILSILQDNNFAILALKKMQFTKENGSQFYQMHSNKPFFNTLCEIMCRGPIVCAVLYKADAISEYRKLMGATNPLEATHGTIRKLYGISLDENSVHGSDCFENAEKEINLIFHPSEIFDKDSAINSIL